MIAHLRHTLIMRPNSFTVAVLYEPEQRKDPALDKVRGPPASSK